MEQFLDIAQKAMSWFFHPLFELNKIEFSAAKILFLILATIALFIISKKAQNFIIDRLLVNRPISTGSKYVIATLVRYTILIVGLLIVLGQAGIQLDTLTFALGALGVGIGFGLQNIINNLVSGILILFEKPIQVGDRVEVGGIEGNIEAINIRATTVRTNDNVSYIVPNSEFISNTVINWSHGDRKVRRRLSVGVHYKEDPEQVRDLLLEVAKEYEHAMESPGPDVLFTEFGDSALNFELRVWTDTMDARPGVLTSDLNFKIAKKFKENGIEIPYPQRDLYIKERP